jgi:hypothetical protein
MIVRDMKFTRIQAICLPVGIWVQGALAAQRFSVLGSQLLNLDGVCIKPRYRRASRQRLLAEPYMQTCNVIQSLVMLMILVFSLLSTSHPHPQSPIPLYNTEQTVMRAPGYRGMRLQNWYQISTRIQGKVRQSG